MEDENNSEFSEEFNENLEEMVKSELIPLRNLGIEITDDHIRQYRQIQIQRQIQRSEASEESDGKVKRSRKHKLTIERRLDKKHFDAVFRGLEFQILKTTATMLALPLPS